MDDQRRQQQAIAALRQQRDAAVTALEVVEYVRMKSRISSAKFLHACPWCLAVEDQGHFDDCQRQAALALCQGQQP